MARRGLDPILIEGGESRRVFSDAGKAHECLNFVRHPEGGIVTVQGPALLENPHDQLPTLGWPHGIFHTTAFGNSLSVLLIRAGTVLYRQAGWDRSWQSLVTGLTDEREPRFPDQFCQVGDNVVWTNGIDRPRIITPDGRVYPLGFDSLPPTPQAIGPYQPDMRERSAGAGVGTTARDNNELGYSWFGNIGTVGGLLEGQGGSLLRGAWVYYLVLEDALGNLSAPSAPSAPMILREVQADPWKPVKYPKAAGDGGTGVELDDLLKSFLLTVDGDFPGQTRKIHVYRTPDQVNIGGPARLLTTHHSGHGFVFPDEVADAELGAEIRDTTSVPLFRLCCTHQGRLIMANSDTAPGRVWAAEPGFPGTLLKSSWVDPDPAGAEITGVVSHGGRLYAMSADAVHDITDFYNGRAPITVAQGIGCVAPGSMTPIDGGRVPFLTRNGFYALNIDGTIEHLHPEQPDLVRTELNQGRLRLASAAYDRDTGEYRCGAAPAGFRGNRLIIQYDQGGIRRMELGVWAERMASAYHDGHAATLVLGHDQANVVNNVWVLDRETVAWEPPTRSHKYRSAWASLTPVDHVPVRVKALYLGFRDAASSEMDLKVWINGEYRPVVDESAIFSMVGPEEQLELPESDGFDPLFGGGPVGSSIPNHIFSIGLVGDMQVTDPRVVWRKATVDINDVRRIQFQISGNHPKRAHLIAFAWDAALPVVDAAERAEGPNDESDEATPDIW